MSLIVPWLVWKLGSAYYSRRVARAKGLRLAAFRAHCWLLSETTLPAVLVLPRADEAQDRYVRQAVGELLYYTPAGLLAVAVAVSCLVLIPDPGADLQRLPIALLAAWLVAAAVTAASCGGRYARDKVRAQYHVWTDEPRLTADDKEILRALWQRTPWPGHVHAELWYEQVDERGPRFARLVMTAGPESGLSVALYPLSGGFGAEIRTLDNIRLEGYSAQSLEEVVSAACAHPAVLQVFAAPEVT